MSKWSMEQIYKEEGEGSDYLNEVALTMKKTKISTSWDLDFCVQCEKERSKTREDKAGYIYLSWTVNKRKQITETSWFVALRGARVAPPVCLDT